MGTWGCGSFENDTALDWAGSVQSPADVTTSCFTRRTMPFPMCCARPSWPNCGKRLRRIPEPTNGTCRSPASSNGLNPDLESSPWEPADIEKLAGGPGGPCAFCDRPIDKESLFGMNIHDCSDRTSFPTGLWFHLPCLNARLHHSHMIANFKFDPDNLPDLDQLCACAGRAHG